MVLRLKVRYPKIDKGRTTDKIHEQLTRGVTEAAKAFVIAATSTVPVWSGASKASFLKLASEVDVAVSISPREDAPNRIPLGIGTSKGFLVLSRGRSYSFVWESGLDYIGIVESNNGFVAAGLAALERRKFAKLPQPVIKR